MARSRKSAVRRRRQTPWWSDLPYQRLLDVRLCDLELRIEGTALQERVGRLYIEMERKGLRFRPHVWLSLDWFTPDDVHGFAMPFYLAHPRLQRIEHRQMFETEGGTHDSCMKLLRHETGHAIDNAYHLYRRKRWREAFGRRGAPYRDSYTPKPNSKDFVQNLDFWYAQSHPCEDFAESFAVWLNPGSRWRSRYDGWPALEKLAYIDELMSELGGRTPPVRGRRTPDSLPRLRTTLRDYYRKKKSYYGTELSSVYDRYLSRLFTPEPGYNGLRSAAEFLRRSQHELRNRVSAVTGQYRYVVDQFLRLMIQRCRELGLRQLRSDADTVTDAAILLTVLTTRGVHFGRRQYHR